jgi:hypothetical protein
MNGDELRFTVGTVEKTAGAASSQWDWCLPAVTVLQLALLAIFYCSFAQASACVRVTAV